jgi:sporulation protein YlmC with PRC-barrel domain
MNGIHASDLMGVQVTTTGGDEVGPVSDLVIDQDGQVVGIVLGVGGFLGMGEKNVAIGWDDVSITGTADELELEIGQSRESLMSAPEFETQEDQE